MCPGSAVVTSILLAQPTGVCSFDASEAVDSPSNHFNKVKRGIIRFLRKGLLGSTGRPFAESSKRRGADNERSA